MIILMGTLTVPAADVDEFIVDTKAVAIDTRAEPGCLFYGMAVDDAAVGRFLVAQRWRDQAALDAHLDTPHAAAFLKKWAARFATDLRRYDAAGERPL